MGRPIRLRSDSLQTQAKLISVAERLFAEHGIDGVSLSEINRAAEQGNNSALHYHFGSKQGIFDAIFEKHAGRLAADVGDSLAKLPANASPREIVACIIEPLARRLDDEDGGAAYIRIMSQAQANPTQDLFKRIIDGRIPEAFAPFSELFISLCPALPPGAQIRRFNLAASVMFLGLSEIANYEARKPEASDRRPERVEELVDSLTGLLTAPSTVWG